MRETILAAFAQVAKEQGRDIPALTDETRLVDSGLDSLCFAIIVARLEDSLGVDPFATGDYGDFPTRFGDFVRLYEGAGA
jgi:hypothetical protein